MSEAPGLAARAIAVATISSVLDRRQRLDDAFDKVLGVRGEIPSRDRAFARLMATTALRRLGEIDAILAHLIERPLPEAARSVRNILRVMATQLLFLETPAHAAVDSAVRQVRQDERLARFAGLVNAVGRRLGNAPRLSEPEAARANDGAPSAARSGTAGMYPRDIAPSPNATTRAPDSDNAARARPVSLFDGSVAQPARAHAVTNTKLVRAFIRKTPRSLGGNGRARPTCPPKRPTDEPTPWGPSPSAAYLT